MDSSELISAARTAIGEGDPDDYVLAASQHADALATTAPALAQLLRSAELCALARQREAKAAESRHAQGMFKRTTEQANWAVFLTACFAACLLIAAPLSSGAVAKGLQVLLGIGGIASGALAAMWLFKLREGQLLERWMSARAAAEIRRLRYFELATAAQADGGAAAIPLSLLQLEYFRRYQLQVQQAFYRLRSGEHERAADRRLTLSALAVALASFATGIAGLLGGALDPRWAAIGGLAVIATALSAFVSAKEAASQDRRNKARYRRTLAALDELNEKLEAVRNAVAAGAREPLTQFVAAVHEQLSLEHRQWLDTSEGMAGAIARLEDALSKWKTRLPGAGDPTKPPRP